MFDAQIITAKSTGTKKIYSPWFPKGGDSARFSVEILGRNLSNITVEVFTKDSETKGNPVTAVGTIVTAGTSGTTTTEIGSLNELVRYKYAVSDNADGWVLFRMLEPVWFDAV